MHHLIRAGVKVGLQRLEPQVFIAHVHEDVIAAVECTIGDFAADKSNLNSDRQVLQYLIHRCLFRNDAHCPLLAQNHDRKAKPRCPLLQQRLRIVKHLIDVVLPPRLHLLRFPLPIRHTLQTVGVRRHTHQIVALPAQNVKPLRDALREGQAFELVQKSLDPHFKLLRLPWVSGSRDDGDFNTAAHESDDVLDHRVVRVKVVPVRVQRAISIKGYQLQLIGRTMHLGNIEDVSDLCKVGLDVLAPAERKVFVVFLEGLRQTERDEDGADGGDESLQGALVRRLHVFVDPAVHFLHDLEAAVRDVHALYELDEKVLLLEVPLASEQTSVCGALRPRHVVGKH
mmetsp:Transcript_43983/g.78562  ORF Transcript_43983/g.78562 Transcript_43983/m.78562 type:complete len:341 (+) Transcript_43983:229-1251(+)